jgi:hypothetical protein
MDNNIDNYNNYKKKFSKILNDFINENNYNFNFTENEIINIEKIKDLMIQIYLPLDNHDFDSKKMKKIKLFACNLMSNCSKEEQKENFNILNQILLHALFFQDKENLTKKNLEERFNILSKSFEIKFKKYNYYSLRKKILEKIPFLHKEDIKNFSYHGGNFQDSIKMLISMLNIEYCKINFYNNFDEKLLNDLLDIINNLLLEEEEKEEEEKKKVKEEEKDKNLSEENDNNNINFLGEISNNFLKILKCLAFNNILLNQEKNYLKNLCKIHIDEKMCNKINKIDILFLNTFSNQSFEMMLNYLLSNNQIKMNNEINNLEVLHSIFKKLKHIIDQQK